MSKRKTAEEYKAEMSVINPDIEVLGEYTGSHDKIEHRCKVHDVVWSVSPTQMLTGCGCRQCQREKLRVANSKTHEQYVKELSEINPDIEILGKYQGVDMAILHRCKVHDVTWSVRPANLLRGQGCMQCGRERTVNARRKTHEEYVNELKAINPNVEALGKYINTHTPILHRCLIDQYEWNAEPAGLLSGRGCPKCANNILRTHESYIEEVKNINPNIDIIEQYINLHTPILHKCNIHNIEWKSAPTSIFNGAGCPQCTAEKYRQIKLKTHEQYVKELKSASPNIIVIDKYINGHTPIKHQCIMCGYTWETTPASTLQGTGCPKCSQSRGERQIAQWLDGHNIQYISQYRFKDCRDKRVLPFDFYLPERNQCIEYDGEQHYVVKECFDGIRGFELRQKHDNIKTKYCVDNGISLLRIPYYKEVEEELNNFLII